MHMFMHGIPFCMFTCVWHDVAMTLGENRPVRQWLDDRCVNVRMGAKTARVKHVLETQPRFCSYATAAEVAERADINGATVVRFAQSLGYAGWPQLQHDLRAMYLSSQYGPTGESATPFGGGLIAGSLARDADHLANCLQSLDHEEAERVVSAIASARRTIVVAEGTHALPAQLLAVMTATRGLPVTLEDRGGVHLANSLATLTPDDCVLAWSFTQHYRQTIAALRVGRSIGATTCAVTDSPTSPAAEHADHLLVVPSGGIATFPSMTVATSLAYGLAAELIALDPERSRSAIEAADAAWNGMGLFATDADS